MNLRFFHDILKTTKGGIVHLTTLLLIIVAILTALSGIAVFSGAHKGERIRAFLFFFTTIMALIWAIGIGVFLSLPENTNPDVTKSIIDMIYIGAPVMCWGLMAYACHSYKLGQIGMVILGALCLVFAGMILMKPELLYSGFTLSEASGNVVHLHQDNFYILYGAYHFLAVGLYIIGLGYTAYTAKTTQVKKSYLMVLIGFTITGILALVYDFILPYFGRYDTIWVGILAMSIAWIFHYYAILRYHLLNLSSPWLKTFSRVIVLSCAAVIYLVIFFIIFAALFKTPVPSAQVIVLNVLMIAAVMLLIPALNELSAFVGSLASADEIDVSYIVKKMTAIVGYDVNLTELSSFLCDHLHFQYIGFILNGELYGSSQTKISPETVKEIARSKKITGGIWLEPDEKLSATLHHLDISAVAELRDGKGKIIGQIIFGKPNGHINFENRDIVPIEIIIQVLPVVIKPGNHRIKRHLI